MVKSGCNWDAEAPLAAKLPLALAAPSRCSPIAAVPPATVPVPAKDDCALTELKPLPLAAPLPALVA